jgi:hypothetical protein
VAQGGRLGSALEAVSKAYDGQMIDSSSIRVHQHAANAKKRRFSRETFWYDGAESPRTSPAVLIESGFAGGQAKMAARLRSVVQADCDGRSSRPAVSGRVRHAGAGFDADMTADQFATGGFRATRGACGASLSRARSGLVAGLKLVGPRGFAKAKANSGGATAG